MVATPLASRSKQSELRQNGFCGGFFDLLRLSFISIKLMPF